jgi:hypothetical protein
MSAKELKLVYESLRDSGDLLDMYPNLTGEWKKDKPIFKQQYEYSTDFLLGSDLSEDGYEF